MALSGVPEYLRTIGGPSAELNFGIINWNWKTIGGPSSKFKRLLGFPANHSLGDVVVVCAAGPNPIRAALHMGWPTEPMASSVAFFFSFEVLPLPSSSSVVVDP